jgi:hypothetical protein
MEVVIPKIVGILVKSMHNARKFGGTLSLGFSEGKRSAVHPLQLHLIKGSTRNQLSGPGRPSFFEANSR